LKKSKCNGKPISLFLFVIFIFLLFNSAIIPYKTGANFAEYLQNNKIAKKSEVIRVLLFSKASDYFLYKGNPVGFQYELCKELEKDLEKEVSIMVKSDINIIIESFFTNSYDIVAIDYKENQLLDYYQTFSIPHSTTYSVLVGKKEVQMNELKYAEIMASSYLPNNIEKDSLPPNIVWNIIMKETLIEDLFEDVQNGDADFLVCDYNEAVTMLTFYTDLIIFKQICAPYERRWRFVGKNRGLNETINHWIEEFKKSKKYEKLCKKYFSPQSPVIAQSFDKSKYNKISPFDAIVKHCAEKAGLDWRFLASIIFQESKFHIGLTGLGGSFGVMQLMPATATSLGITEDSSLEDQIRAGCRYLTKLRDTYKNVPDENEQLKFIAGAYNSGPGHINDAWRLCVKYGKDPFQWKNIAYYLALKNKPEYHEDNEVKHGYYQGSHTVKYVTEVMERYIGYKASVN